MQAVVRSTTCAWEGLSADLLEDVELQVAIGHHLFQPSVFLLELTQAFGRRLQAAEMLRQA